MVVIIGVATAAAAAIAFWRKIHDSGRSGDATVQVRQQVGVLAALVNMVSALLDALTLFNRPRLRMSRIPSFGVDADEL